MDEMDQSLLRALRHDARASLSQLAQELGVSRATVRARLERMQTRGEILGFSVVTRGDLRPDPVRGLMMLSIDGRGTDRVVRALSGLAAVRAIHSTNGRWDLIVELGTDTLERLDQVLTAIRRLDGVATSETSLLLATRKSG